MKVIIWAKLTRDHWISINDEHSIYSIFLGLLNYVYCKIDYSIIFYLNGFISLNSHTAKSHCTSNSYLCVLCGAILPARMKAHSAFLQERKSRFPLRSERTTWAEFSLKFWQDWSIPLWIFLLVRVTWNL